MDLKDLKDLVDRADLMNHLTRVSQSFKVLKYDYKYIILIYVTQDENLQQV
jgi:hypothetical protein